MWRKKTQTTQQNQKEKNQQNSHWPNIQFTAFRFPEKKKLEICRKHSQGLCDCHSWSELFVTGLSAAKYLRGSISLSQLSSSKIRKAEGMILCSSVSGLLAWPCTKANKLALLYYYSIGFHSSSRKPS